MTSSDSESSDRQIDNRLPTSAGSAAKAGLVYFAIVFAVGFLLGMIRVPFLAPLIGDVVAVLIELPLILTSAWFVCWKIVRVFHVAPVIRVRLVMGGVALVVLLMAELALSTLVFGNSVIDYVRSYLSVPHALGLVGQCAFGSFPTVQMVLVRQGIGR